MKYLKQMLIISIFCFIGEVLNYIIPLQIPASIYGMLLMFLSLTFKIIKIEQVEDVSNYFLTIMLILFVPSAVSIMNTFFDYKYLMIPIFIIVLSTTIVVMAVTGLVAQLIANVRKKMNTKLIEEGNK